MYETLVAQLLAWSLKIKNQTKPQGNTETLVGGLFEQIVRLIKQIIATIINISIGWLWQEPVETVAELSTKYPNPKTGWTALVKTVEGYPNGAIFTYNGANWVNTGLTGFPNDVATKGTFDGTLGDLSDIKPNKTETRLTILGGNYVGKTGTIVNGERQDRGYSKMVKLVDGMTLEHYAIVNNNNVGIDRYAAIFLFDEYYMFIGYLVRSSSNDDISEIIDLQSILEDHPTAVYCRVNVTVDKGFNIIVPEGEKLIVVDDATVNEKLSFGELNNATSILYDKPMSYDNKSFTLTIPEDANARIIEADGDTLDLQAGSYVLGNSSHDGYRHVYVKRDGTLISVLHSANQTRYSQHYMRIGWVYPYKGAYDFPNLLGSAILIDGSSDIGNEPTNKSEWLKSYAKNIKLQPNINNAIQAIKDIWFDFPSGETPAWFNDRTPILRSVSSSKFGTNNLLRIAFMLDEETGIDEAYAIDYSKGWANNSVAQYRVEKEIEGTKIGVNFIVDSSRLLEYTNSAGNVITTDQGLELRPTIHKKTNSSIHSVGRFARGANVKSILIGTNTEVAYIEYNTTDRKLTIPENTRLILNDGSTLPIVSGVYSSENQASFVFVSITTGEVSVIKFGELANRLNKIYWDENLYVYIGMLNPHLKEATIIGEKWKVDGKIKGVASESYIVPQIFNNPLPRKSSDYQLKIVLFGSSWFMNTWWYLNKIIKSAGINAKIVGFYTGGASMSQWNERFDNDSFVDAWTSEDGSDWTKTSFRFKTALEQGWDIIAFQQGAWQAKDWANWANEWSPLVRKVKLCCGIDTVMVFNSTWTPAIQGNLSPYPNTVEGRKAWQQDNYNNTKRFIALSGVDVVSPCGALLWTMRQNNTLNLGNDLASDGLHPDHGLPMYALSLMFFFSIIARVYGISLDQVIEWLPDENTQQCPAADYAFQPVNTDQRALIMKMIKLALSDRFGFNEI